METALKIRRLCLVEGKSISEVARRFHLSRTTVRKYLKEDQPPRYNLSKPRPRPRLGNYESTLTRWLERDQARPKRERRTATRLFADLQQEGYTGAYDLSYSRKPFVVAYPRESLEMVLDAHMRALAFYQDLHNLPGPV